MLNDITIIINLKHTCFMFKVPLVITITFAEFNRIFSRKCIYISSREHVIKTIFEPKHNTIIIINILFLPVFLVSLFR